MATQTISISKPGDLKPYPRNPRTHSKQQVEQIAKSVKEFGWTVPILVDGAGMIIAGHARIEAAKLLGLDEVPTILIDYLTEAQKRAYIIADNKLSENADWDLEILAEEIEFLTSVEFDLPVSGLLSATTTCCRSNTGAVEPRVDLNAHSCHGTSVVLRN